MFPTWPREMLGFSEPLVARAHAEGLLVGKGEGFTSREWRAGGGPLLAVHADAADQAISCVIPFVAGIPWADWNLAGLRLAKDCPHCTTVHLKQGALDLHAAIPDAAARRKMLPVGLDVQASVVALVREWRHGAVREVLVSPIEGESPDAAVISGRVRSTTPIRNDAAGIRLMQCEVESGDSVLAVVGPDAPLAPGDALFGLGRLVARIGAPKKIRGQGS